MSNIEKFRAAYTETLAAAVEKHPDEYFYPVSEVPRVVEKMIAALKVGQANNGPAIKAAARKCGIKPTQRDIKAFLNAEG